TRAEPETPPTPPASAGIRASPACAPFPNCSRRCGASTVLTARRREQLHPPYVSSHPRRGVTRSLPALRRLKLAIQTSEACPARAVPVLVPSDRVIAGLVPYSLCSPHEELRHVEDHPGLSGARSN